VAAVTVGLCESHDAHTSSERVDVTHLRPALTALADLVGQRAAAQLPPAA
jgi:hypothetical protein